MRVRGVKYTTRHMLVFFREPLPSLFSFQIVSLGDQYGVHVEYTIAQEVPNWITSDQCRLTQVLLNLASNAVQYTASRGKPVLEDKQNGEGEADYCDSSPHTKKNVDLELKYLDHCKSINIRIRDTGGIYDATPVSS